MKQTVKLFALLAALMLLITAAASCEEKAEKPVFEEVCSERIAAYYGDQGLMMPGAQYACRAFGKADFEAILQAIPSEEDVARAKVYYLLVNLSDERLTPEGVADIRTVYAGLVTDDNPAVYVCDTFANENEIAELDRIFAGAFGVEIDTADDDSPADAALFAAIMP